MNYYLGNPQSRPRNIKLISIFLFLLLAAASSFSQVPDPGFNDPTDPGNTEPAPVTSESVTTSNLANMNESADTSHYVDRESSPFNVGLDLKNGFSDNLFNSSASQRSGFSTGFGVPAGLRLRGKKTQFDVNYRFDKVFYPQFSNVNNSSQTYSNQLEHHSSEYTTYFWNLAAGRVASAGQYLPSFIAVGGTGVSQASAGANAAEDAYTTTNAATSLGLKHVISEKDQASGTVTFGWVEQAQGATAPGTPRQILRSEVSGLDLRLDHAVDLRAKIGIELTNVYVRGLTPLGHENDTSVQASYGRTLTSHLDFRAAAGPLFSVSGGSASNNNGFSYAANAAVDYHIAHALMGLAYARVLQLSYIQVATSANQFSASFDRELSPTIDLTLAARYVHADSSSVLQRQSTFGLSGRVDKRIAGNVSMFVSGSRSQQRAPVALGSNNSYDRDELLGGLTLLFGNSVYRRGAH